MEVSKEFLLKVKEYIERREVAIDGEWGIGRSLQELIKDNEMPEIYDEINALLSLNNR